MTIPTSTQDLTALLKRYLLAQLPDGPARDQLDDALLEDDELYIQLESAEDDLVDDYVRGNLTLAERNAFRTAFLTTSERRRKLEFAIALNRYAGKRQSWFSRFIQTATDTFSSSALRPAYAAVALAVVLLLPVPKPEPLPAVTQDMQPVKRGPGSGNRVVVKPDQPEITVRHTPDDAGAPAYEAYLARAGSNARGRHLGTFTPTAGVLEVTLNITGLPDQEYLVRLYSSTASDAVSLGGFSFRLVRQP
ncbi:MAG: hypothetical protein FJW40_06000 [Acidobacteria bacterium]|nr:hypothetical protein [Acidobacteriota bacterium]